MEKGFIKLFRKLKDWKWYTHPTTMRVFIHLLICASWEDKTVNGLKIKRGQVLITWKEIAEDLKIYNKNNKPSRQPVRTALKNLKLTNDITIKKTNKGSIITINNYNNYQDLTTNLTNKKGKINQQPNHEPNQLYTKEEKNIKNNIYIYNTPDKKLVVKEIVDLQDPKNYKPFDVYVDMADAFLDYFVKEGHKLDPDWKKVLRFWLNFEKNLKELQNDN